eukprot:PITA_05365
MDVKSSFLHGDLHEEIYMEQPPSFIKTYSNLVCWLNKSLYGLKKSPRAWYAKMDSFLLDTGFSRCHSDTTAYTKKVVQFGIHYSAEASPLLVGFTDSNWTGDPDDHKSATGYVFTLVSRPITWACKKQSAISLSSAEAEYLGVIEASKEALWLRQILSKCSFRRQHMTTLWCDN